MLVSSWGTIDTTRVEKDEMKAWFFDSEVQIIVDFC